jgi:hypothetical protein
MRDYPQVEVTSNPNSDYTTIVAGGLGNDGIAIGRAMRHILLPIGSIVAVRYAETNIDSTKLHGIIDLAINQHGLGGNRLGAYLNSAAGLIMAAPIRQLGKKLETLVLDASPSSVQDVKGLEGFAIKAHTDVLRHSRAFSWLSRLVANHQMPPPTDKEPETPYALSAAHRSAIVNADTITTGAEAAFIRNHPVTPGSMLGIAKRTVYMHSRGNDPLIDTNSAFAGWSLACGGADLVTDPYRPIISHAAGPTYPRGVGAVLLGNL